MKPEKLGKHVVLYPGDCLEALKKLPDNSIDSCVTDPPYGLEFMGKEWDTFKPPKEAWAKRDKSQDLTGKTSSPFLAAAVNKYEAGTPFQQWCTLWATELLRVMKPGAHLLAFGGTRTYHRLVCGIEDAGFEIRDQVQWLYGSGFPKGGDVGKVIDKKEGVQRKVVGTKRNNKGNSGPQTYAALGEFNQTRHSPVTEPESDFAKQWDDWSTAIKPANEPIVLARKPLEGSVVDNLRRWGVGALNIGACRIATDELKSRHVPASDVRGVALEGSADGSLRKAWDYDGSKGRYPANVIHDGSDEVVRLFPADGGVSRINCGRDEYQPNYANNVYGKGKGGGFHPGFGDGGSAARFYYTAKADVSDRVASKHPTVKPVDLIQYLVRLVTPPGGTVLDPFAGTGTAGEAAILEGMKAILIERELPYQADIRDRISTIHPKGVVLRGARMNAIAKKRAELPQNQLPKWLGGE